MHHNGFLAVNSIAQSRRGVPRVTKCDTVRENFGGRMDIVKVLRNEESKLTKESGRIAHKLASIRMAIGALAGKTIRTGHTKRKVSATSRAKRITMA